MIPLSIRFHPDPQELIFPEVEEGQGVEASIAEVVCIANGMQGGRPSVALKLELPDGKIGVALTSARLFCTFARMMQAKHPDLFEGE
jgi:hypothetical protein